jgi:hypothetical protein
MTLLSVKDGARMLGVHPKTLHQWLGQAHMPLQPHPADGRVTCLTREQAETIAALHARSFPPQALAPSMPSEEPPTPLSSPASLPAPLTSAAQPLSPQGSLTVPEGDPMKQVAALLATIGTMQEQLTQLVLTLCSESLQHYDQRLSALEGLLSPQVLSCSLPSALQQLHEGVPAHLLTHRGRALHPAELRARSRVIPLIEQRTTGAYVVICPQEGELALIPDSAEWFEWLATLSSFRFVGPHGRFTAHRKSGRRGQPSRSWAAIRGFQGRRYENCLGVTDHLTIACLEQAAATIQAHLQEP